MKKLLAAVTLASVAVLALVAFAPFADATAPATHWYVCKYVGPPGSGEVLQGGDNPIFVDENAIDVDPVAVGSTFSDAQSHSLVIAGPYAPPGVDPEPVCPGTPPPPPPTSTTPPPPPPPTTTTPPPVTTTTPPPVACVGAVHLGPWYGDPRINIDLTGKGTFVVSGGVQRFTGLTTITKTLACNETFRVNRYKVEHGHYLTVTMDGKVVVHVKPPRVR